MVGAAAKDRWEVGVKVSYCQLVKGILCLYEAFDFNSVGPVDSLVDFK